MLTVFIATHDGAETLPRVLAAYCRLQPPPGGWKVVLIDNRSNDDSAGIARSFADRLPLVLAYEARRGKNRALNAGLAQLEGDLTVFSDDDTVPESDWLVRLRNAADRHPEYAVFGGNISPIWEVQPDDWILEWVRIGAVFAVTDATREDGPCDPTKVWGPNMAVRAEWFRNGYRFDESLGPNGSAAYSMGGETELTLRLTIAEQIKCWHSKDARVHHIVTARQLTKAWILKRAFHLGRCVYRESRQQAAAGRPHIPRSAASSCINLATALAGIASAKLSANARGVFEARWQLNLWLGCLFEALGSPYEPARPVLAVGPQPSLAASVPAAASPNGRSHQLVSIVLPTYQRGALIGRSIRSVLEQTYTDFELIVVDDGSTDDTAAEVARFSDPRLRYLRLDANRGAAAARNVGIRHAAGELIAFQDSDDEWLPTKLERHMEAFAGCGPDVGVVYSDMDRIRRDGTPHEHRSPDIVQGVLIDPDTRFYQVCKLGIQSTIIRRECFAAVGGFNEKFPALEDLELFIRLSRRYRFHHLRMALVRYHETDGLSQNMAAKVVARTLLLDLYETDLARADSEFVARERDSLQLPRHSHDATGT